MLRDQLIGKKVVLRPFRQEDISSEYLDWLNNPEVVRYSNQRFYRHTLESCQQYLASFHGSHNHFLAICDAQTQSVVGTLTVYHKVQHGTADIGIMIGDSAIWGQGIGLDAFQTVIDALVRSGEIRKITAGTLSVNRGMVRIMHKVGMTWEATRKNQELVDGLPVDIVYYAKFCDAWS